MPQMTWMFQGRQEHGEWGHGTAPHSDSADYRPEQDAPATVQKAFYDGANPPRVSDIPPAALIPVLRQLLRHLKPGVYALTGPAAPLSIGLAVTGMMPAHFDPRFTANPVDGRPDARAVIDWAAHRVAITVLDPVTRTVATVGFIQKFVVREGHPLQWLVDQDGNRMGEVSARGLITLNEAGDQALRRALEEQRDSGPALPDLQLGFAVETRTQEERDLVAHLQLLGLTNAEIQNALDDLRDRHRREAEVDTLVTSMRDAGRPPAEIGAARETLREIHERETGDAKKRNDGLPPELRTYASRARKAAVESDDKLREALAAAKVLVIHFAAHHLIPIEAVHKYLELFEAAARAGWRPDEAENLVALPRNPDAQKLMDDALGERRGVHDSGHPNWNRGALEELDLINKAFQRGELSDADVRRQFERIQDRLRKNVPKTRVTMLDRREGVA